MALLLATAALSLWALHVKSSCPPKQPLAWEIQGKEYSGWNKQDPKESVYIASQKESSNPGHYHSNDGYGRILETWFCEEAKLTDFALMVFTFWLVVIGALTMWTVDATAKRADRAYVFGGGPYGARLKGQRGGREGDIYRPDDFADWKRLTIQNYGRTPGLITEVTWGLYPKDEFPTGHSIDKLIKMFKKNKLPKVPGMVFDTDTSREFIPPTQGANWLPYRRVSFPRKANDDMIFWGKITYKDIFGDERYSVFKLHLTKSGFSDPFDGGYDEHN